MAPHGQNLSDSDRFNQPSDPSIVDRHDDDDDDDDIPPPPSTYQQQQRRQRRQRGQRGTTSLIVVPRSTRRKMVSDDVRRKTTALPGFSDWRATTTTTTSGAINDAVVVADSDEDVVTDNNRRGRPRSGSGGRRRRRTTSSGGKRGQRRSSPRPSSTASYGDGAEAVVVVVDDDGRRAAMAAAAGQDDCARASIARVEYERAYVAAMSEVDASSPDADASSSSRETSLSLALETTFLRYVDERLGVATTRRASWRADDDIDDDDGGPQQPPPSSSPMSYGGAVDPPPSGPGAIGSDGGGPTGTMDPPISSPPSPAVRNDGDDGDDVVVVVESSTGRTSSRGRDRRGSTTTTTTTKRADHPGNRHGCRQSGGSRERRVGTRRATRSTSAGSRDSLPSSDIQDMASVCSKRSSNSARSNRSNRSRSDRSIGSRSYQQEGDCCIDSRYSDADGTKDDDDNSASEFAGTKKRLPRKGFLHQIKQLASKVKNTLGELGGLHGVHKFQLGERARYKTLKIRDKNWMIAEGKYDVETKTVAVEVVAVHIDAVLEAPYYTILLPDGSRKRTNWDSLMTLSEYKKIKSAAVFTDENGGKDDDPVIRSGSRMRGIFGFSSRSRGGCVDSTRSRSCSSRRGREEERERERSTSRQSRRSCSGQRRISRCRSSSNGHGGADEDDSACKLSRQTSRSRLTHGSDSTHRDGGGNIKVCSNSDGNRSHRARPRSQSPFPRRHEVEQVGDRHNRRTRSTKKHQYLSCPQPCAKSEGAAFQDKKSTDSSSRRIKYERQASVRLGSSLERNTTKKNDGEGGACASDPNHCHSPHTRRSLGVSSECSGDSETAEKSLTCVRGIVVEDVNDDSSCW